MTFAQWEIDGDRQAADEAKKRIKQPNDFWSRTYQQITGDVDYLDSDVGEAPKGV